MHPSKEHENDQAHGPANAEHEIRKAYNSVMECGVALAQAKIRGVDFEDLVACYKKAFHAHRQGDRLSAERWARSVKHLARAFWHEAKLAYVEPRATSLPYLEGATAEEYNLHDHSDTASDLINSVAEHLPPGLQEMPEEMNRFISRARLHLQALESANIQNEMLRFEHINCAHEYGRVVECLALAYEAAASKAA